MKLDLHVHTTASDGSRSPEDVVEAALTARLDVLVRWTSPGFRDGIALPVSMHASRSSRSVDASWR